MGGNHLSAGANWPQRLWEGTTSPTGGIVAQDAGPPTMRFNGGSVPYTADRARGMAAVRLREERPLAVLERHHVGEGTSRDQDRDSSSAITTSRPGLGAVAPRRAISTSTALAPAGSTQAGNNLNQTGDPFASFLLGQVHDSNQIIPVFHTFRETYTALFINDEFKVSDKLTLTLRPALRLSVGPDRKATNQVLDLQPDDAEPRSGRHSRRDHLRGRRSGPLGTDASSRTCPRMRLGRAWASPIGSTTSRPFAAATGCTTRTSRSISSAARRRRASHRTRSRRTTPTASSRRITWTPAFPRTGSSSRRSSIRRSTSVATSSPSTPTV